MMYITKPNLKRDYNKNEPPRPKFCKGVCAGIKSPRPIGSPYKKGFVFCSRCGDDDDPDGVWMMKDRMKANGKCPCCNFRPRYKPFKQ